MMYFHTICLTLAIAVLVVGCATFGEKGHWTKQEQDYYLRKGK